MSGGVALLRDEVTNSRAAAEYPPELQLIPFASSRARRSRRSSQGPSQAWSLGNEPPLFPSLLYSKSSCANCPFIGLL